MAARVGAAAPRPGRDRLRRRDPADRAVRDLRAAHRAHHRPRPERAVPTNGAHARRACRAGPSGTILVRHRRPRPRRARPGRLRRADLAARRRGRAARSPCTIGVLVGHDCRATSAGSSTRSWRALMDVVLSFPFLLFAIALVSIVGPSLTVAIVVIVFFSWASVGAHRPRPDAVDQGDASTSRRRGRSARATCGSCSSTSSRTCSRR